MLCNRRLTGFLDMGTAIVPAPEFTRREGDVVAIIMDGIGVLENDVIVV